MNVNFRSVIGPILVKYGVTDESHLDQQVKNVSVWFNDISGEEEVGVSMGGLGVDILISDKNQKIKYKTEVEKGILTYLKDCREKITYQIKEAIQELNQKGVTVSTVILPKSNRLLFYNDQRMLGCKFIYKDDYKDEDKEESHLKFTGFFKFKETL
jgi:hypothetical protein